MRRNVHDDSTLRRLLLTLALSSLLGSTAAVAQSWTSPVVPELWNQRLEIGPVEGLTTIWHRAPVRTSIPLGATVRLRIKAPTWGPFHWTGAHEIDRRLGRSIAEVSFDSVGSHTVSVAYDTSEGGRFEERSVFDVVNTTTPATVDYEPLSVSAVHLHTDSVVINPENLNTSSMDYFFRRSSIAALRQVGEDRYHTSIHRTLVLEAVVQPSGFAPLIEWRLDGEPQQQLGSPVRIEIYTARLHTISAGPVAAERQVEIETYRVRITSHRQGDDIPEGIPVTFNAVTDPPGYEDDVTWLASTKYGSCQPLMGEGPEFTVLFEDTFGAEGAWLGVRADNIKVSLDEKGMRETSPLGCQLRLEDLEPEIMALAVQYCEDPPRSFDCPDGTPNCLDCDQCPNLWVDCMQGACTYPDGQGGVITGLPGLRRAGDCSPNIDVLTTCSLSTSYCEHGCERPDLIKPPDP